jgi:hypothetical protein
MEAIQAFMKATATGETITRRVAQLSGYDVHALQRCMDVAAPELELLSGFKPLGLWLRVSEDSLVTSEQELEDYRRVREIMRLYVNINRPEDERYEVQTVGVYVSQNGSYLVAVAERPDELKQHPHSRDLVARIAPCANAAELAEILNPMHLQIDRFSEYSERGRLFSPLTTIAHNLRKLYEERRGELTGQSVKLGAAINAMQATIHT